MVRPVSIRTKSWCTAARATPRVATPPVAVVPQCVVDASALLLLWVWWHGVCPTPAGVSAMSDFGAYTAGSCRILRTTALAAGASAVSSPRGGADWAPLVAQVIPSRSASMPVVNCWVQASTLSYGGFVPLLRSTGCHSAVRTW